MAAVELELIVYCIKAFLGELISAVTYPPATVAMRFSPHCIDKEEISA